MPLVRPNTLVFGQKVWTALRQHPKIVEAVAATGAGDQASGIVMKEAVAELFEVDSVLVGMAWYQSAKRGQADAFARLWGKHACAIHVRRDMASARDRMPKFCWTADALGGLQVGTYEEPARGVNRGSTVVKVSECVKELVAYGRAGHLCATRWHSPWRRDLPRAFRRVIFPRAYRRDALPRPYRRAILPRAYRRDLPTPCAASAIRRRTRARARLRARSAGTPSAC